MDIAPIYTTKYAKPMKPNPIKIKNYLQLK